MHTVELTLEDNALTGPIPPLYGLERVVNLNFGSNFLTSTIPTGIEIDSIGIVFLPELNTLTLRDNLLTGPIPTELGLAPRLGKFLLFRISSDRKCVGYILTLPIVLGV